MRERAIPFFLARETQTPRAEKEGASCRRHFRLILIPAHPHIDWLKKTAKQQLFDG
jgi:hypothetical protein